MLASLPARKGGEPFPSHPTIWIALTALLVVVLVAKPRTSPQPVPALATPLKDPIAARSDAQRASDYAWLSRQSAKVYAPLERRIATPADFTRVQVAPRSFGEWLRNLPVRPTGTAVLAGNKKAVIAGNSPQLAAVIDLQPGNGNLLNAANIVLRLRSEYLWADAPRDAIRFHFTNGQPFEWSRYRAGARPTVSGRNVTWNQTDSHDDSRTAFTGFMESLFKYSSIYSLHQDTQPVTDGTIQPGDVFVSPGRPGHAVLVVDVATSPSGDVRVLLGQGGTPAQTFHLVAASAASPWFEVRSGSSVLVPGWGPVQMKQLRRWPELKAAGA